MTAWAIASYIVAGAGGKFKTPTLTLSKNNVNQLLLLDLWTVLIGLLAVITAVGDV